MLAKQLELFKNTRTYGPDYNCEIDGSKIERQHETIRDYMWDGTWRTLSEIESATGYPQASVSAQLRHLRKPAFGAHTVEKRRRAGAGTWEYRIKKGDPFYESN